MKLGQTITEIRKDRKMTQEEFAQIFHVTRQTVSNWEKGKNYPDLETLIYMSEEFNISLDVMLKEDNQMVKKLNRNIKFSENFRRNTVRVLVCIAIVLALGAGGWGIAWNNAKNSLDTKFKEGMEMNGFLFDEKSGCYQKTVDQDTYFTLPNQEMPGYFEFAMDYHEKCLDYYTRKDGENIHIRWIKLDQGGKIEHSISDIDKERNFEYTLPDKQEKELCEKYSDLPTIITEGEKIYEDVYLNDKGGK